MMGTAAVLTLDRAPAGPELGATLHLSRDEAATLAAHLLAAAISCFSAANRAEAAQMYQRADECRRDAVLLTKLEMRLRGH